MIQLLLFNMNYLPGNVQRILVRLIEEMATYSKENGWKGEMKSVLELMRENIVNQPVWGGQLGSSKLWEEHRNNIQKILNTTSDEDFDSDKGPPILHFPEEVIRQILLKLSSDKDIETLSNTHFLFNDIAHENRVWRQLCNYHFTAAQKDQLLDQQHQNLPPGVVNDNAANHNNNCNDSVSTQLSFENDNPQWKLVYKKLKRKHGLNKEEYAEELNLCKTCGLLFWATSSSNPHDCGMAILIRVKPGDFIKYFCV
ncbi:F-box only protein 25 [Orchesella cincta]|uniref:F-box only protein 25 n=1 Tax=Orchesella cincta TaxID=48709 RepID=A0A1D2NC23_ORCCI|nr:F-box only protein 25 [Orchesella cincta]